MKKLILLILSLYMGLIPCLVQANIKDYIQWSAKGLSTTYYYNPQLPMVDVALLVHAGSAYSNTSGLANLTTQAMAQQTQTLTQSLLSKNWVKNGAVFNNYTDKEKVTFSLRTLTRPAIFKANINQFIAILTQPKFTVQSLTKTKEEVSSEIQQSQSSSNYQLQTAMYAKLYPSNSFGNPTLGTMASLKPIAVKDIKSFYKKFYNRQDSDLIIVGNLTLKQAKSLALRFSQALKNGAYPTLHANFKKEDHRVYRVNFNSPQTTIGFAQYGISQHNKNYLNFKIANFIFGSGMSSILFKELREKQKLTYAPYSTFYRYSIPGPFLITFQVAHANTILAINACSELIKKWLSHGPSLQQLSLAKNALVGGFSINLNSNEAIMNNLENIAFYNIPKSFILNYTNNIKKSTKKSVLNALRATLEQNKWNVFIVGDSHAKN